LPVPFLHAVESRLSSQVKHEEDSHGIIGDKRQHGYEFALPAEIPDLEGSAGCRSRQHTHRERDFRIPDAYRLLHKVDAQGLNVVLAGGLSPGRSGRADKRFSLKASFHVFHHQ
jgi:hypothetical protein